MQSVLLHSEVSGGVAWLVWPKTTAQSHAHFGAPVVCVPGYDLLKKKSDALTFRFREITRKIKEAKESMGEQMRATIFSVTEAVWGAGDFKCVWRRFVALMWRLRLQLRYFKVFSWFVLGTRAGRRSRRHLK